MEMITSSNPFPRPTRKKRNLECAGIARDVFYYIYRYVKRGTVITRVTKNPSLSHLKFFSAIIGLISCHIIC